MFDQKFVDAETFITVSAESGPTLTWAIKYDPNRPDYVLYYPHVTNPQRCPYVPMHKNRIRRIEPLFQVPCYDAHSPVPIPGQAWIARVTLVLIDQVADAELLGAISAMTELSDLAHSSEAVTDDLYTDIADSESATECHFEGCTCSGFTPSLRHPSTCRRRGCGHSFSNHG